MYNNIYTYMYTIIIDAPWKYNFDKYRLGPSHTSDNIIEPPYLAPPLLGMHL